VELLFHQKGGSASFGAKMVLSLNGVDPSCMNSITGLTCRAKCLNILHDTTIEALVKTFKYLHFETFVKKNLRIENLETSLS
jgi:hypothetical protein